MSEEMNHKQIKVWDISTRLFHWMLVILFGMSVFSAFQSKFGIYGDMHLYSGIAVFVLIVWRILWGVVGSDTARFKSFLRGPKHIRSYLSLKSDDQHAGHNPIGGLSVVVVLIMLLTQAVLGLYATDDILFSGPFADRVENARDITNIHETLGYALMAWVGVHILAILYHRLAVKADLVTPMITGRKRVQNMVEQPVLKAPILSAVCLLLVASGVLWWIYG